MWHVLEEKRKGILGSGRKLEGKRPLGKSRRRCDDAIKRDIQVTGRGEAAWCRSTWLRKETSGGLL
jgi:hypothetical protein